MIQIYDREQKKWIQFYLIDINTDEIYEKKLQDLPEEVVGKYNGGMFDNKIIWNYAVIDKNFLREININN